MEQNNIVLFQSQDGQIRLEVKQAGKSVWLRQEQIAELLGKDVSGISRLLYCIALGYPDETPDAKPRNEEKVRYIE